MSSKWLAKVLGIARKTAALVPHDGERLHNRFALVPNPEGPQIITMSLHGSRNDRDPKPCLGQCEFGMLRTAFEEHVWLNSGEAADRVPLFAGCKAGVPHK